MPRSSANDAHSATDAVAPVRHLTLVVALIVAALNLRPALSSLSTVLPEVMQGLGISASTASLLTMAPVLCLGVFGIITPGLAQRFGNERTLVGALLVLTLGIVLRGIPVFVCMFGGTILAGAGIGVAGVLLPALVKQDFQHQARLMMGVYTMALCLGASAAAGFTVPLAQWFDTSIVPDLAAWAVIPGWAAALAFWAIPSLAAALFWLPQARRARGRQTARRYRVEGLWRDVLAWQVTLFMGLQSSLAYIVFGWLAPILRDRGMDAVSAGWAVSISILIQAPAALAAPVVMARWRAQSAAIVTVVVLVLTGLLGCLYAPLSTIWLWVVILGVAQGCSFALALSLILLRAADARIATHLSSMAQSVGYTLASFGPLLAGLLHESAGTWKAAGPLFIAICILAMIAGAGAGRARFVAARVLPAE